MKRFHTMLGMLVGVCAVTPATAQASWTVAPAAVAAGQRGPQPLSRATFTADMDRQFGELDANRDGAIVAAEIVAAQRSGAAAAAQRRARATFGELDADRNSQLSFTEFAKLAASMAANASLPPSPLLAFDANKDGRITQGEYRAATQANFARADRDKDNVIGVAEMRAAGIIK